VVEVGEVLGGIEDTRFFVKSWGTITMLIYDTMGYMGY
jgi:hypothetical protein